MSYPSINAVAVYDGFSVVTVFGYTANIEWFVFRYGFADDMDETSCDHREGIFTDWFDPDHDGKTMVLNVLVRTDAVDEVTAFAKLNQLTVRSIRHITEPEERPDELGGYCVMKHPRGWTILT